jgi:hexosaminidase
MNTIVIFFLSVFLGSINCFAQEFKLNSRIHIVPQPASLIVHQGCFRLDQFTTIISTSEQTYELANIMATLLNTPSGYNLTVSNLKSGKTENVIICTLNSKRNAQLGNEGYTLQVSTKEIKIQANKPAGLFYGMQSFLQLFQPEIESDKIVELMKWDVPCVNIVDYPRFGWRGMMLDVSRHFFPKEFILRYIDEISKYKFNVFHWHLSDDNGWRMEIIGLPKLTEVGAWRVPRTGVWETFDPAHPGEKATDGGYYSQEDIREVVAYAKKRYITILPEIDVPGHSRALNASYPNLTCPQLQYPVDPGTRHFREDDNQLCVANDSTYIILDKIFTQVANLFPGEYIHVGGDEVHAEFWEKDPKEQALMKREGITSLDGLQRYFEKKLEKIINSKGKKMIGWYELDDQLSSETAFMSWQNMLTGMEAIKLGHRIVMSPEEYCYLDNNIWTVSDCYKFEPMPEGIDSTFMLGAEACLWTERVPNERQVEYMTWPRAMALSEVFWSPKSRKDLNDFLVRVQDRFRYMDMAQVKYSRSAYDPIISGVKGGRICQECDDSVKVKIVTEFPNLDIYYSFDGTDPDSFYPKYLDKPMGIPKGATEIRVVTFSKGKLMGHQVNCQLINLGYMDR